MTALDWETIDLSALEEKKLWDSDLLGAAQAQVQELAQCVWNKSEQLKLSAGFTAIKEMIGDPPKEMPLRSKLKFYRNKVQVLRKQADPHCALLRMKLAPMLSLFEKKLAPNFHSKIAIENANSRTACFVKHQLFCFTSTSRAMEASRPRVRWNRFLALLAGHLPSSPAILLCSPAAL